MELKAGKPAVIRDCRCDFLAMPEYRAIVLIIWPAAEIRFPWRRKILSITTNDETFGGQAPLISIKPGGNTMRKPIFMMLLCCSTSLAAAPRVGHHGDMIMKCHKPMFFAETPANNSKVSAFQKFSFNASANTDIATLKVWVNNKPVKVDTKRQPSGRYLVTGQTAEPINEGKAWLKVGSESNDGCNGLQVWNIFIQ